MRDIFIPGKLTRLYFEGKRGQHFHPMRLFIVTFLFLIAAMGLQISREMNDQSPNFFEKEEKALTKLKFIEETDSLSDVIATQFSDNQTVKTAFDSLQSALLANSKKTLQPYDSIDIILVFNTAKISERDFIELTPDELVEQYNIEGYWEALFVRQGIKLMKDNKAFTSFLLGKSIWIMLAMMPFLALLFKLLYIRRSRYYVEHLIFSFHIHSFAFILLTISTLLEIFTGISQIFGWSTLLIMLYTFFAMKKVYGQSLGKTFAKFIIITIVYLFIFALFLLMGVAISAALF